MAGRSSQARWISVLSPPGTTLPLRLRRLTALRARSTRGKRQPPVCMVRPARRGPARIAPGPRDRSSGCCFDVDHSDPAVRVRQQQARNMTPFPVPSAPASTNGCAAMPVTGGLKSASTIRASSTRLPGPPAAAASTTSTSLDNAACLDMTGTPAPAARRRHHRSSPGPQTCRRTTRPLTRHATS